MTLISMLLALIIERLAVRSDKWQSSRYSRAYVSLTSRSVLKDLAASKVGRYVWLALPGAVVALVLWLLDSHLISLVVNTLVLLVGIGCWHYRQLYKQYLNAKDRGDDDTADAVIAQIRDDLVTTNPNNSHGQLFIWLNFRYYAAVLFWFLILGPFGVITYSLVRHLQERVPNEDAQMYGDALGDIGASINSVAHWANWFPARLFSLGFALVGYFSKASTALISYFLDTTAENEQVIVDVATAAEPLVPESINTLEDSTSMVQLGKRNMLFFLALTAILTLMGFLN